MSCYHQSLLICAIHVACWSSSVVNGQVMAQFGQEDVRVQVNCSVNSSVRFSQPLPSNVTLVFTYIEGNSAPNISQRHNVIWPLPDMFIAAGNSKVNISVKGANVGSVVLGINSSSPQLRNMSETTLRVTVVHNNALVIINAIIGWIYFVAWSVSFYPQVVYNFRRKSVVGLNFDFLAYNLTGFLAYALFNVGMYWINEIKVEYHAKYPYGVNPVQLNDVIFSLHAVLLTIVTITQCFIYERGGQKVSRISGVLLTIAWLFIAITLFLGVARRITWLTFLYYFSYVKLAVTLVKYVPQAYMNYQRKSTEGWSIGNVLLDCTGGGFSLLQMFLLAYNNDDWSSIFGDPTKFGLGLFSILFDVLFMIQHYVLYRSHSGYQHINEDNCKES